MHKTFLTLGVLFGAMAVALGAFGAHGLKKVVPPDAIAVFQTGVQYQMYHSLALLATGLINERFRIGWTKWAGYLFVFGIIFFSGSLYIITALRAAGHTTPTIVGIMTPVGGMFFICGWLSLLIAILKWR
jgi:uncharacterized membrane protein YgdD (TMEM256/DUF423 family)